MTHEAIFGILIWIIGLALLVFPESVCELEEKWRKVETKEPSGGYIVTMRILSFAMIAVGFLLTSIIS